MSTPRPVWHFAPPRGRPLEHLACGLPKNFHPHSLIPLGYLAEQPPQEERYRPERIHRNRWRGEASMKACGDAARSSGLLFNQHRLRPEGIVALGIGAARSDKELNLLHPGDVAVKDLGRLVASECR